MKKVFTCALLIASIAISAQTSEKKQATVRIKKVENINGVETIKDTTYTTDDPSAIKLGDGTNIQTIDIIGDDKNGKMEKVVIVKDEGVSGNGENVKTIISSTSNSAAYYDEHAKEFQKLAEEYSKHAKEYQRLTKESKDQTSKEKAMELQKQAKEEEKIAKEFEAQAKEQELLAKEAEKSSKEMDAEIKKALKEAGVDPNGKEVKKIIIINDEDERSGGKKEKRMTKIVMLKMDIKDASAEDVKRLGAGNVDNKVDMDNMKLYPNPNDGKFNLNFNLKSKGDVEVTVYNVEGKQVYNEKIPNFEGEYNKPIDISSNAKGIYFVKIQQGKHTQVKKISLD